MSEEILERSFPVTAPARLFLSNIRGSIVIEPGAESEIAIRAEKESGSGDAEHTEVRMAQAEDGSVRVETRYDERAWFLLRKPCRVNYIVRVPHRCDLKISGVSNRAAISGVDGDLVLSTVSGPLQLADLSGQVKANAVSGKIEGERLSAKLELETVSGGVSLRASNLPAIHCSTVSGAVHLESSLGEGPYRFRSVSGEVVWRLPADSACSVEFSSLSGRFQTDLPHSRAHPARRSGPGVKETLDLNGGGAPVAFHSVSGGLRLVSSLSTEAGQAVEEATQPSGDEQPAGQAKSMSAMEVLERIERGEITVEQGVELMK